MWVLALRNATTSNKDRPRLQKRVSPMNGPWEFGCILFTVYVTQTKLKFICKRTGENFALKKSNFLELFEVRNFDVTPECVTVAPPRILCKKTVKK